MAQIFILPKFSELPPPPNSKTQANFNKLADAFVIALPPFQKQLNNFSAAFESQSSAVLDNIEALKDGLEDQVEEIRRLSKQALVDIAAARAEVLDTASEKAQQLTDQANASLSALLAAKVKYEKDLNELSNELLKAIDSAGDDKLDEYYTTIVEYKNGVFKDFADEIKALVDANRDDLVGIKGAFTDFTTTANDIKTKGEAYLKEVIKQGQEGLGDTATKANEGLKATAKTGNDTLTATATTANEGLKATATTANEGLKATALKAKEDLLALPTVDGFKNEVVEEIKKESGSLGGGMGVDGMIWVINQEALLLKNKLKNYN